MKAVESFDVSESFGLENVSFEEITEINGGAAGEITNSVNVGTCKLTGPSASIINIPRLSGMVGGPTGTGK